MPGWRVHRYVDIVFFGKSYSKIHRKMDAPVVFLGRRHRVLFHNPVAAVVIAQECYPGDPDAVESAYTHILTDEVCSSDPVYKKFLEKLALRESRNRQGEKKTEPTTAVEKRFLKDLKQLAELRKLFRIFYSSG